MDAGPAFVKGQVVAGKIFGQWFFQRLPVLDVRAVESQEEFGVKGYPAMLKQDDRQGIGVAFMIPLVLAAAKTIVLARV